MGARYSVVQDDDDRVLPDEKVATYSLRNFYRAHVKEFNSNTLNANEKHLFVKQFSEGMKDVNGGLEIDYGPPHLHHLRLTKEIIDKNIDRYPHKIDMLSEHFPCGAEHCEHEAEKEKTEYFYTLVDPGNKMPESFPPIFYCQDCKNKIEEEEGWSDIEPPGHPDGLIWHPKVNLHEDFTYTYQSCTATVPVCRYV